MFALYKKELQSYFLSPVAYFVIAFFMATFSLTLVMDISNVSSATYEFSFPTIFYTNLFYFIFLIPLLTMRTFAEERKNGTETLLLSSPLNVTQIVLAKFLATATILLTAAMSALGRLRKVRCSGACCSCFSRERTTTATAISAASEAFRDG